LKLYSRLFLLTCCLLMVVVFLVSCAKEKKQGQVIITEQEFTIRQDSDINWVIDAKGKVKNVGDVDVKNVVITGYCRSCTKVLNAGIWTISDYEKNSDRDQIDTISYLTAGDEDEFSFKEVAFYFHQSGLSPENLPENLEVVIESFEPVE
jgi:hypothetical protein